MLISIIIYIIGSFYFMFCYIKNAIKQKEKFHILFCLALLFWPSIILYSFFKK